MILSRLPRQQAKLNFQITERFRRTLMSLHKSLLICSKWRIMLELNVNVELINKKKVQFEDWKMAFNKRCFNS